MYYQSHGTYENVVASIQNSNEGIGVAAVSSDIQNGNYLIKYKIDGKTHEIKSTSNLVEPLCYPLLFPYGETGWSPHLTSQKINYMPYLASRILMPENNLYLKNQNGEQIQCNRFQILSRLMQYYIVESVSRAIDYRLRWLENNKSKILSSSIYGEKQTDVTHMNDNEYNEINDMNDEMIDGERIVNNNSNKTYLAESFTGSPRHLKSLALDAMTIVSEFGESTAFITVTYNPLWPEVKERLAEMQTVYDRTEIICLIFKARLTALIHNIKHGKYFGGRKTEYFLYVIEYQARGLPHAHIVFRLKNAPTSDEEKIEFINKFFHARYPDDFEEPTEIQKNSAAELFKYEKQKAEHERYVQCINNNMTHKCSSAFNGCKDKNGICKKGYMTNTINKTASFDLKGYPVYYRKTENDLRVVPHNKEMLLDWDGHINVEFCGKVYAVMYLYNYLFKGKFFNILFFYYNNIIMFFL